MILYFSATGNSLAVARQLAEQLNEQLHLPDGEHIISRKSKDKRPSFGLKDLIKRQNTL